MFILGNLTMVSQGHPDPAPAVAGIMPCKCYPAPTIVNLTQHSYFNLAEDGDVLAHELMITAGHFTPVDQCLIPTGELRPVAGGPFDFRQPKTIGRDLESEDEQLRPGHGFDHNFVFKTTLDDELLLAARVLTAKQIDSLRPVLL
jgi:aldose 1-epimerase